MCNLYEVGPPPEENHSVAEVLVSDAARALSYVAPGKSGLVLRWHKQKPEVHQMRWGFHRPWNDAINNARTDKLDTPMWQEAFLHRRCLIPMRWFYEWSGPKGAKKRHAITFLGKSRWNYVAGIWERSDQGELCYSMLTSDSHGEMAKIHPRMPLGLSLLSIDRYLAEGIFTAPPEVQIQPPLQEELF